MTTDRHSEPPASEVAGWYGGRAARIFQALPDRIVLIFIAAALAISVALIVQAFTVWLVLPLFVVAAVLLWRFLPAPARAGTREGVLGAIAALVIAVVYIAGNIHFTSQLVQVTRDPGIYTALGIWLTHHSSIAIDTTTAVQATQGLSNFSAQLGAFPLSANGMTSLQGGALLPGLLGVAGWIGGARAVLAANLVIGGVALLACYGLARRFVRPLLAIAIELALGFSVAFIYLTRAPYSEIIIMIVCAAGLTWLIEAVRERRVGLYVVGGLLLGSADFARIDGPLALIGAIVVFAAAAVLVRDRERFLQIAKGAHWFILAGVASEALGLLSLYINERSYLQSLKKNVDHLWGGLIALIVLAEILILLRTFLPRMSGLGDRFVARFGAVIGALVIVLFGVWLSRPLWWHGHAETGAYAVSVAGMQAQQGLPIDGSRSYDEYSLFWYVWYYGWPALVLAAAGMAVTLYVGIRYRRLSMLFLAFSTMAVAVLYIDAVNITPDQPWAFRRLLPIIVPGFLISGAYVIELLMRRKGRRLLTTGVGLVLAALMVFAPFASWSGVMKVADAENAYPLAKQLCSQLTSKNVLMVQDGAPANYAVTLATLCDVNVITGNATNVAQTEALEKRMPDLEAVVFAPSVMPGTDDLGPASGSAQVVRWNSALMHVPNTLTSYVITYWVGKVVNGGFVPLSS